MKMLYRFVLFAIVLSVVIVACGDDARITDPDPDPPPALSVTLTPQTMDLTVGDNGSLAVGISGGDPDASAIITCESSDTNVVTTTVSGTNCAISAVGEGTATITGTVEKGEQEASADAAVNVEEEQPEASSLQQMSGDAQSLAFNEESAPLTVQVEDQFGNPFSGAQVSFSGEGVAHSLSALSAQTDASGEASVTVTSGEEEGSLTVTATVDGVGAVTFGLTVEEDPAPDTILVVVGAGQTLAPGEESEPFVVQVNDQFGDPFPGATVDFSGSGVDHSLSTSSGTTDGDGRASVVITAGQVEGTIEVSAGVAGVASLTVAFEVDDPTPDAEPTSIERFSGNNQTLDFDQESAGLVVLVTDQFGDPFPGAEVTYSGSGVDHTLSSTTATTDANGRTSVTVTAGQQEGEITVEAGVAGVGSVTFTLQVEEAEEDPEASAIVRVSGDGQTLDLDEVSAALVVRVDDQFGNPYEGATVTFDGDGVDHSLSSGAEATGPNGEASITVTAAQDEGTITVTAGVDGVGTVTFTLEVVSTPAPASLVIISGDGQKLAFNETSDPLVVEVRDQFNDIMQDVTVDFTGSGVDHVLSATSDQTDGSGQARITVTAQEEEGSVEVEASVNGLTVTFNLDAFDPNFVIPSPGTAPRGITWDGTDLWVVTNGTDGNPADIHRIDPATGASLQMFAAPSGDHRGLTWDGSSLWYSSTSGNIYELNPTNGNVESSFASPADIPRGLAWDGTHLWHNDATGPTIYRVGTDGTVDTDATISNPVSDPLGLTWDGTHLWSARFGAPREITRVDPSDGSAVETVANPGTLPLGLAWDTSGPWLWVTDQDENQIYRLPR